MFPRALNRMVEDMKPSGDFGVDDEDDDVTVLEEANKPAGYIIISGNTTTTTDVVHQQEAQEVIEKGLEFMRAAFPILGTLLALTAASIAWAILISLGSWGWVQASTTVGVLTLVAMAASFLARTLKATLRMPGWRSLGLSLLLVIFGWTIPIVVAAIVVTRL